MGLSCSYSVCPACVCVLRIFNVHMPTCSRVFIVYAFLLSPIRMMESLRKDFLPLICFWILPPFNWVFSIVWNPFTSSNSALGVFNMKSDNDVQQTKLNTILCRLKWCLKFAHCMHHICVWDFWLSEISQLSNLQHSFVASVTAWIRLNLYVMIK